MIRRRCTVALIVAGGLAAFGSRAGAQSVHGTVARRGVSVEGAIVMLLDSAGQVVARGVSHDGGAFTLAAQQAGRYSLRVLSIGYAPTAAGPVRLSAGAPVTLDVSLTGAAVRIAELRITDRATCEVRPDSDAAAFRLWEQARTALLATALTQQERLTMRTSSFLRRFDAAGQALLADSSAVRVVATVKPFVSLPPDSLAAVGYVLRNGPAETMFWAPDAEVLLSPSFASSHCLRTERASVDTGAASHWIGIAFLPSGGKRDVAEVEGVLWLDRATAELRRLDYRYVNVPEIDRLARSARAGGRVEFLRLPTGGWIVPRWSIRLPLVGITAPRAREPVIPGVARPAASSELVLTAIQEAGGDVSEVRRGDQLIWQRGRVGYRVRIMDPEQHVGLPESLITIDAQDSTISGPDGVALFPRITPGGHLVGVRTRLMTQLGSPALDVSVIVPDDQQAPFEIASPSDGALLQRACGARVAARHESILRGSVRAAMLPVPDARVEASWQARYTRLGGGEPVLVPQRATATTSRRGEFLICGVPRATPIALRTIRGTVSESAPTLTIAPSIVVAEQQLVVSPR